MKELENEIMNTVSQYPELMTAMRQYNDDHSYEKVSILRYYVAKWGH